MAGAALGSAYLNSRRSKDEKALMGTQRSALTEQTALAKQMGEMARERYALTKPAYERGLSYYGSLAGGDRGKAAQAMAPDIRSITDIYKGGASSIDNTMRGAARDQAQGRLTQERTADIAALAGRGRMDAMGKLFGAGESGLSNSTNTMMSSLQGHGSAANLARGMQQDEAQRRRELFEMFSKLGIDIAKMFPQLAGGGGNGGGNSLPGQSIDFTKLGGGR
jgi:hypothetical protein